MASVMEIINATGIFILVQVLCSASSPELPGPYEFLSMSLEV